MMERRIFLLLVIIYTKKLLIVTRSDNSFEVYVDQSLTKSGNLLSDFT